MKCPRPQCDGTMKKGIALQGDTRCCLSGLKWKSDGTPIECLKCNKCGHSKETKK